MKQIRLLPSAVMALCIGTLAPGLALALEVSAVCYGNVRLDGDQVGNPLWNEDYGPGSALCFSSPSNATPTGADGHARSQGYASPGLQQAYSSALGEVSLHGRPPEVTSASALVGGNTEIRVVDRFTVTSSLVSPGSLLSVTLGYSVVGTVFSAGLTDGSGRGVNTYSVALVQGASVLAGSSGEQSYQFGTRNITGAPGYRESTNDGSAFNGLREMTISVNAGSSIDLYINMRAQAGADAFAAGRPDYPSSSSYTTADMGHSLTWAGISAVLGPGGNPLSEYSALSASGFDYSNAFVSSVPENNMLVLLLAGLGVLHLQRRTRSARNIRA
jgi:hypothetical protein